MNGTPPQATPSPGRLPPRPSRRWLGVALTATLAATAWFAWQDDAGGDLIPASRARSVDLRVARNMASRPTPRVAAEPWPEPLAARRPPATAIDSAAWSAPSPPPVQVPRTPVPDSAAAPASAVRTAPAFAYALIGRLDDGQPFALLSGPLRSLAVKAGDVVDGEWRVDAVRPDGVVLTWLPGNSQQQLGFKSS